LSFDGDIPEERELYRRRLREARAQRGMSLRQLAAQSGLCLKSVEAYSAGRALPSVAKAARIARALQVPLDFFAREATGDSDAAPALTVESPRLEVRPRRACFRHSHYDGVQEPKDSGCRDCWAAHDEHHGL
jgi:transcriptional regulator with XRE-family HTH domain